MFSVVVVCLNEISFENVLLMCNFYSDNGISRIPSISNLFRQNIFFAEFGTKFVLKYAAKVLKIG